MSKSNSKIADMVNALPTVDPLKSFTFHTDRVRLASGRYAWVVGGDRHQVSVKHVGDGMTVVSCRTRDLRSFFAGDGLITKEV